MDEKGLFPFPFHFLGGVLPFEIVRFPPSSSSFATPFPSSSRHYQLNSLLSFSPFFPISECSELQGLILPSILFSHVLYFQIKI
jgi:hypothetical protein